MYQELGPRFWSNVLSLYSAYSRTADGTARSQIASAKLAFSNSARICSPAEGETTQSSTQGRDEAHAQGVPDRHEGGRVLGAMQAIDGRGQPRG